MHIRMSIHIGVVIRKRWLNAVVKICFSVFIVMFLKDGLSNKYSANICGNSHLGNTAYMVYSSHKKGSYSSFSNSSINLLNSVLNSS